MPPISQANPRLMRFLKQRRLTHIRPANDKLATWVQRQRQRHP